MRSQGIQNSWKIIAGSNWLPDLNEKRNICKDWCDKWYDLTLLNAKVYINKLSELNCLKEEGYIIFEV